jgi:hypothetical protein
VPEFAPTSGIRALDPGFGGEHRRPGGDGFEREVPRRLGEAFVVERRELARIEAAQLAANPPELADQPQQQLLVFAFAENDEPQPAKPFEVERGGWETTQAEKPTDDDRASEVEVPQGGIDHRRGRLDPDLVALREVVPRHERIDQHERSATTGRQTATPTRGAAETRRLRTYVLTKYLQGIATIGRTTQRNAAVIPSAGEPANSPIFHNG